MGTFVEKCDDGTGTVHNVEFTGTADDTSRVTADVELTVRPDAATQATGLAVEEVAIDDDGCLSLALRTETPVVPGDDHGYDVEATDATLRADGSVSVSVSTAADGEGRPDDEQTEASARSGGADASAVEDASAERGEGGETARDRDVPPFRNPELLADVYESCETFAEMSEAIDMDVTAETVRRYMIDYGIHEPNRYDTDSNADSPDAGEPDDPEDDADDPEHAASHAADASTADDRSASVDAQPERDADATSPVVLTDGLGLPDGLTVDDLVETVSRSNTVYEVGRDVGLDREETLTLLRRVNLDEFVGGRIRHERERRVDRDVILDRLRDASTEQPQP